MADVELLQAEIEALRAEAVKLRNLRADAVHECALANIRAERLAEALSHQRWCRTCAEDGWESCEDGRKADALLNPTAAQEDDDA